MKADEDDVRAVEVFGECNPVVGFLAGGRDDLLNRCCAFLVGPQFCENTESPIGSLRL
jgi:hypothetical protein